MPHYLHPTQLQGFFQKCLIAGAGRYAVQITQDTLFHLSGGFVGEGYRKDIAITLAAQEQPHIIRRQREGLTRSCRRAAHIHRMLVIYCHIKNERL